MGNLRKGFFGPILEQLDLDAGALEIEEDVWLVELWTTMAENEAGTATGPQRVELRLLLKRLDPETQGEFIVDVNPDDPDLSDEDAADGIKLLTQLLERHERENEKKAREWKEANPGVGCGCLVALGLLLVLWWFGIVQIVF